MLEKQQEEKIEEAGKKMRYSGQSRQRKGGRRKNRSEVKTEEGVGK